MIITYLGTEINLDDVTDLSEPDENNLLLLVKSDPNGPFTISPIPKTETELIDLIMTYLSDMPVRIIYIQSEINKTSMLADGIDTVVISNLPNPTHVEIDDNSYDVTDGSFEFSIDVPGEYPVRLSVDDEGVNDREYIINAS